MKHIRLFCAKLWPRQRPTWRSWVVVAIAAVGGVFFGRTFLGSVSVVDGPSMAPTYLSGTHLLTVPIRTQLQRSDVVLLDDGNEKFAVKRIIGLPGETVHIWRGHVFINRRLLAEPYLPKHTYTCPVEGRRTEVTFYLGEGQYFVMGDNRLCSTDSRTYGPVDEAQIRKRVPLPDGFLRAELALFTLPAPPKLHSQSL